MEFSVLASGSKGNCTVIKSEEALIIVDCGMSWKYLEKAFVDNDIEYRKADALLITHMHIDHNAQIKKFKDITKYLACSYPDSEKVEFYKSFRIKDLEIMPLPLSHDCPDTTGYVIKDKNSKLVYITDTGYISENNKKYLKNADYYIMESNHDPVLLLNTERPRIIKQRIICDDGHLSNGECAYNLQQLVGSKTKEIVLAHLSSEANSPEMAILTLTEIFAANKASLKNIKVTAAEQFESYQGGKI